MALRIYMLCDECSVFGPNSIAPRRTGVDYAIQRIQKEAIGEGWQRSAPRGRGVKWLCGKCANPDNRERERQFTGVG